MPEIVADTSPIQYLYQTGLLETLASLYGTVIVPDAIDPFADPA